MHRSFLVLASASLALTLGVTCGCREPGPPRYRISGTVTYQGKPVPIGSVLFQPDPGQNNSGPVGSATIKDGVYDTQREGRGFSGGPQIVIVEAFDGQNIDPDYNPYGSSLTYGYMEPHPLPESDTTLDIELSERTR